MTMMTIGVGGLRCGKGRGVRRSVRQSRRRDARARVCVSVVFDRRCRRRRGEVVRENRAPRGRLRFVYVHVRVV